MSQISTVVVRWLINSKAILPDDKENYEYAVFCFLITFTPLALVMIIGALLNIFLESVLFVLPFMFLRKFSGGFHLKSMIHCLIFSTFLISLFLVSIKFIVNYDVDVIVSILVFISSISLMIFSPIDSEARKLSDKEKEVFKKILIIMLVIIVSTYIILLYKKLINIYIPIGCGVMLTSLLQVPCILNRKQQ